MRRLLPVLLLAAGVVIPVPAAVAGTAGDTVSLGKSHGVQYMRAKYLDVITQAAQPVQCDGDSEVSGGGGAITGSGDDVILNESYPTPESGWRVEGSKSVGPSRTLTGYALCVGADLEYYFTTENVTTGSSISNGAPCAFGELVTGGGLQADLPGLLMNWTRPEPGVGARWYSYAQNEGGLTMVVDYWTVCSDSYVLRYRTAETTARKGREGTVTAKCKAKEAVMGGGFHGSGTSGGVINVWPTTTKPWDSKDDAKKVPDDGWRVTLQNGSNEKMTIVAHAVCLRGK